MDSSGSTPENVQLAPDLDPGPGERTLRQLRIVALVSPVALVAIIEVTHLLLDGAVSPWVDRLLVMTVALVAAVMFYASVFRRLAGLQDRLARQNRELLGLHRAGLAVAADLSLDSVLQTVVDNARYLVGTRYGALSVIDETGAIESFITDGIDPQVRARIGDPPRGHGLLGVSLHEGQRLRVDDLTRDPRSIGFPPHHPPMRTLLAVPIVCRGPYRGNLYLSEKLDGSLFTGQDEETLVRFASQAAIAIDNAHLHRQVRELGAARERIRIAHEMHDGLAQVLAYVNTKAQVVREYLRQSKPQEAQTHLEQLSEAARECYSDVRGQILELRTPSSSDIGLANAVVEFVQKWERQSGISADLRVPEEIPLESDHELQLLRIMQEALNNVRKHARANHVRVSMEVHERHVKLLVADDGSGFPTDGSAVRQGPRFGLTTMRERAESAGGTLDITSEPGGGTRVEAVFPVASRKENKHASAHR